MKHPVEVVDIEAIRADDPEFSGHLVAERPNRCCAYTTGTDQDRFEMNSAERGTRDGGCVVPEGEGAR